MTTSFLRLGAAFVVAALPAWSQAQTPPIKPGLWEVKSEGSADGQKTAPPTDRLASLPPAVRAQVEASMKQKGIAVDAGGLSRICFTKESMDPAHWGNAASCKTDYGARSNSSWKWHSVCTQPEMTIDGEALFASAESYTVNSTTTMKLRGETKTSQRTVRAKWLGADCGDLKPFDPKR
ncbi:MAG: DUF3617 domain-containing protein [Burkholderiales bacterium]|nr:DUF3617 domain-containing protein [Burkholderiales bacterium]